MKRFSQGVKNLLDGWWWKPRTHYVAHRRPAFTTLVLWLLIVFVMLTSGCVQRQLTVHTEPEGAVVFLNDREIGRTPFTREFLWYGNYDVVCRMEGFKTLKTTAEVTAPFWQFVPFDAITDFLPLQDHETISFKLKPDSPTDPQLLVQRGMEMQKELNSSEHTVQHSALNVRPIAAPATTQSTTQLTTQPTTQATTQSTTQATTQSTTQATTQADPSSGR